MGQSSVNIIAYRGRIEACSLKRGFSNFTPVILESLKVQVLVQQGWGGVWDSTFSQAPGEANGVGLKTIQGKALQAF